MQIRSAFIVFLSCSLVFLNHRGPTLLIPPNEKLKENTQKELRYWGAREVEWGEGNPWFEKRFLLILASPVFLPLLYPLWLTNVVVHYFPTQFSDPVFSCHRITLTIKKLQDAEAVSPDSFMVSVSTLQSAEAGWIPKSLFPPYGKLYFLDTEIVHNSDGSLTTKVYRKTTHTDKYLSFDSIIHCNTKMLLPKKSCRQYPVLVCSDLWVCGKLQKAVCTAYIATIPL